MSSKHNNLHSFGEFRLDAKERILFRDEEAIILASKVFDTLLLLVKRHGEVVSKQDLMDEVWADSFVEEGNLTQNIYLLRQTLGKGLIETVPRRGYRFAAGVEVSSAEKTKGTLKNADTHLRSLSEIEKDDVVKHESLEDDSRLKEKISKKSNAAYAGIVLGVLVLLAVSVTGFWIWNSWRSPRNEPSVKNVGFENLTRTGRVSSIAMSPKGDFAVYTTRNEDNKLILRLRDINVNQDLTINLPENIKPFRLKFSPDGNHIYFLSNSASTRLSDLYKITRFGGTPELVANGISSEFGFSKNGKQIAFVREGLKDSSNFLLIKDLETGNEKVLVKKVFPDGLSLISAPAWSRDSKTLYVISRKQRTFVSSLIKIDIRSGEETEVKTPKWMKHFFQVETTPNENELLVSIRRNTRLGQIYKIFLSDGTAKRITNDLSDYRKISVSGDGKKIFARQNISGSNLWMLKDGKFENAKQLTFGSFGNYGKNGLEILPDGKILFVSTEANDRDIWTMDLANDSKTNLTKDITGLKQYPIVSAIKSHIYFVGISDSSRNIHRMDFDGKNKIKITSDNKYIDSSPTISRDGKMLFFLRQTKEDTSIWKKELPNGTLKKISKDYRVVSPGILSISPDGKYLAFQKATEKKDIDNEKGTPGNDITLGIIQLDRSDKEPIYISVSAKRFTIRWAQTSDAIEYVENTIDRSRIWRINILGGSKPDQVLKTSGMIIRRFVWTPNGYDLLLSDITYINDGILITNFD